MRTLRTATIVTVLLACALPALAQDAPCRTVHDDRGGRVIRCEPTAIEGSAPRPFVVMPGRSASRYEAPPLERELAPEIRRTVRRAPF